MENILRKYNKELKWNVAGAFNHHNLLIDIIENCIKYKINIPINSVYDGFNCIFHGGRFGNLNDLTYLKKCVDKFNNLNIKVRLTFSNPFIKKNDLSDTISNDILYYLNNNKINGVIISSDILKDYIKEKYPNLEIISSFLKPTFEKTLGKTDDVEYYNNLLEIYDYVVLNTSYVHNLDFLNKLNYKEKIEILANQRCLINCPLAKQHYSIMLKIDKYNLNNHNIYFNDIRQKYDNQFKNLLKKCSKNRNKNPMNANILSITDINQLSNLGIINFKLEGRDNPYHIFSQDIGNYIFDFNNNSFYPKLLSYIASKQYLEKNYGDVMV